MRIARWITKATDTHSEYVILLLFHWNYAYMNAPCCYVTVHFLPCYRQLPVRTPSWHHSSDVLSVRQFSEWFIPVALSTQFLYRFYYLLFARKPYIFKHYWPLKIIPTIFRKSLRIELRKCNIITTVSDEYLPALMQLCTHLSTCLRSWMKFLQQISCQCFWNIFLQLCDLFEFHELCKACILGWTVIFVIGWLLLDQLHYLGL
jgi:hypothetical protein